jgi:hypothetical protein
MGTTGVWKITLNAQLPGDRNEYLSLIRTGANFDDCVKQFNESAKNRDWRSYQIESVVYLGALDG